MADKYLKDFDAESPNLTDYIIMTGGTGNDSDYKTLSSAMAKLLIETYAGSTLGGSARSVQSAIAYVVDELSQRLALSTDDRTSIPTGSDLNTYTTIGNYKVTTATIAGNISNIPQATAGTLVVMTGSDAQKWYQIYFAQPSVASLRIYVRQKRSDSLAWTDWIELTYRYTFDSAPTASSTNPVTSGGVYTAIRESADDLMEKIAPAYSNTSTYKLGDLCAYNGTIYKCSIEIATAEEWTEAHWEVTNVTDNLQDISEYVNATYVSDIPQTDYFGITRISENYKLKLYGTATANRHLLFLNGQDAGMITTSAFQKTLDAGTYLFDFQMTGYKTTGTLRGTYTTFASPFDIVLGSERTAIYTFTQPVMIGLYIYSGNNYGTESDPTYVTVDAYKLTARDDVARNTKADQNGTYLNLAAGSANAILSDSYTEDSVPYKYRQIPAKSKRLQDKIIGGSVAWNQLMPISSIATATSSGITFTNNSDGSWTLTGTPSGNNAFRNLNYTSGQNNCGLVANHVYYLSKGNASALSVGVRLYNSDGDPSPVSADAASRIFKVNNVGTQSYMRLQVTDLTNTDIGTITVKPMLFDLTQMFGSTIADYILSLETATAGAGVSLFRSLFPADYYAYNVGELKSIEGLSAHKIVGFNQFDKTDIGIVPDKFLTVTGEYGSSTNYKVTEYIKVVPGSQYYLHPTTGQNTCVVFYTDNKDFISSVKYSNETAKLVTAPDNARYMRASYHVDNENGFCVNLSNPSRNGTYEPYEELVYPLDDSLTLRGIPKLVDNKIKFDGDIYAPDGTVTKRYGIVDLSTLSWELVTSSSYTDHVFQSESVSLKAYGVDNFICNRYEAKNTAFAEQEDKTIRGVTSTRRLFVRDTGYETAEAFMATLTGAYIIFELTTPTTETAQPYQETQICSPDGTEEYVSTGIVPVGHETKYYKDIVGAIEGIPDAPSVNGTYVLKCTVSSGVATYSWVTQ